MCVGLTLHKAANLVKFDLDFSDGNDRQVIKRIRRIGQDRPCHVWRLMTVDNTEEFLVKLRQDVRFDIDKGGYSLPTAEYDGEEEEEKWAEIINRSQVVQ